MEIDVDDGAQHRLDNIEGLVRVQTWDAFVRLFFFKFFLSTFGKSSKRTPIQSVMKRMTIAERAPATCSAKDKGVFEKSRPKDYQKR